MKTRLGGFVACDFFDVLDQQIRFARLFSALQTPRQNPYDWTAQDAVVLARSLIGDRAWRRPATRALDGVWHKVAKLLYEAATGVHDKNLFHYVRACAADQLKPFFRAGGA